MAFCGTEFSDQLKEEQKSGAEIIEEQKEAVYNHSLRNVVPFSTSKKEHSGGGVMEGLLHIGNSKDRRIKVVYKKEKWQLSSIFSTLQIKAFLPKVRDEAQEAVGSGLAIRLDGKRHALTCAHNMATMSTFWGGLAAHTNGYCYSGRYGEQKWREIFKLDMAKSRIHPKYDGDSAGGFDIAVCRMKKREEGKVRKGKLTRDSIWGSAKPESLKKGMKIELSGYPGEKEKLGYQYVSSGEIVDVRREKTGGWVLYYNADTTPGMSGSPIKIVDGNWLDDNSTSSKKNQERTKKTIGIHTGYDNTVRLNYGTLITPELYEWICNGNKLDVCEVIRMTPRI